MPRGVARRRSGVGEMAVRDDQNAVGKVHQLAVVGRRDGGDSLGVRHAPDQSHDLAAGLRVKLAGRLVREEQLGVVGQGAGDADSLLLAAGQLVRPLLAVARQVWPRSARVADAEMTMAAPGRPVSSLRAAPEVTKLKNATAAAVKAAVMTAVRATAPNATRCATTCRTTIGGFRTAGRTSIGSYRDPRHGTIDLPSR